MVQENVVEMIRHEEALDEQETETVEELAQEIAIQRGYYDGPISTDIPAPPGLSPKRAELARFLEWHC